MSFGRPPLKVSPFDARTLSWWKARASKIDMSPSYQRRGKLWSDTDKAYLIDSILNGFDIPKLYVADFTYGTSALNERKLPYAIIDGKQRLEAIFDFFSGRITLNSDFKFLEDPALNIGGLGYKDLMKNYPEIAEIFDNYNLSVMSVVTTDEELINALFVRLNRSKPLTGAEIRNAMSGPAPQVIRELADHEFFLDQIAFPVKRGQDLNAAAKLLLFEFYGKPQETKKGSLDQFVVSASSDPTRLEIAARRTNDVLTDLTTVFLPRDKLLSSAGTLPVYYWFFREIETDHYPHIRDFLVKFETQRKDNRRASAEGRPADEMDSLFVDYDNFNRSTNDLASHRGRLKILHQKFTGYLRGKS